MSHIDDFRGAMLAAGYEPPLEIIPGKFHRFSVNGKRSDDAGFCKMFEDMRGGIFGDFRSGAEIVWQAEKPETMTAEQKKAHRQAIEAARKERELELERLREEARQRAEAIWTAATPANDDHPYLTRKAVNAYGLRLHKVQEGELLVVPMRDSAGTLRSLQFISDTGEKRFLSGGQVQGCYATIGKPSERIYIAEGYATAATIHEATGQAVVVAFNAGNLEPVARVMREKFPSLEIVIAADNDRHTDGNPGLTKAGQAAHAIGARVVFPDFQSDDGSDFNDLAILEGYEAVASRLMPVANDNIPAAANDNVPTVIPSSTVDFYSPLPDSTKGKVLGTIENLAEICRRLGVVIRYNEIKKEDEILIPGQSFSIDNRENASLAWLTSWCNRFKMPAGNIGDFVTYLADQNLYNPVRTWITSKPWDGVSRLQDLYATIQAEDETLKEILMRRWLVSAVAAVFEPGGVSAHGVLVLQGDQYLGKTKWFKSLVPSLPGLDVVQDGHLLRVDNTDNIRQACSNWLVELGELDATFRRSDIAALKSFITKNKDVMRRAYARKDSHFARRTVFFGSVNPKQFLHDQTGNRRYWTIECKWIDHSHKLDMQQVWAEVFELYTRGETWYLQPEEMAHLNDHNKNFEAVDTIQERIASRLDWGLPETEWTFRTSTEILLEIGVHNPTGGDATKAATFIRQKNGNRGKRSNGATKLLAPPHIRHSGPF